MAMSDTYTQQQQSQGLAQLVKGSQLDRGHISLTFSILYSCKQKGSAFDSCLLRVVLGTPPHQKSYWN